MAAQPQDMMQPYSAQEIPYYAQLFAIADSEGKGFIDGLSGANFLGKSNLPQHVMHRIWEIADSTQVGSLTQERFYVALRLVAHAQHAGRPPSPELAGLVPPGLPEFEGAQRRRGDSECSPRSNPPSVLGGNSDISELQPVIGAGGEAEVRRAAEYVRQTSPSPVGRRSGSVSPRGWAPSQREKRKYGSLFLRWDWNRDGFVEASEVKTLLERSRLDRETLELAWEHADRDRDGRLTFPEFIALMHLVTCVLRGASLPGMVEGLPSELVAAITGPLETPEELDGQRSRSTSPRGGHQSPTGFMSASLPPAAAIPGTPGQASATAGDMPGWPPGAGQVAEGAGVTDGGFGTGLGEAGGAWNSGKRQTSDPTDGFGASDSFGKSANGFGGFGSWGTGGLDPAPEGEGGKEKKSGRRKKHKERNADAADMEGPSAARDDFGAPWDTGNFGESLDTSPPRATSARTSPKLDDREKMGSEDLMLSSPPLRSRSPEARSDPLDSGLTDAYSRRRKSHDSHGDELSTVLRDFEVVIEADRAVSRQLRREVDTLEEELRHTRDTRDQLEQQVRNDQSRSEGFLETRRKLERELQEAKRRLAELRDDRRAVNLESISLRRDREHFAEELAFLQRMTKDEEQALEAMRRSNVYLEKSYKGLEAHTAQLERQRKEVLQQVAKEKDLIRQEERYNAEMRNKLERMRREHVQAVNGRREADLREQTLRVMQTDGPSPAPLMDNSSSRPSRGGPHSWAGAITGGSSDMRHAGAPNRAPPLAAGLGSSSRVRTPEVRPAGPRNREGV
eukprot:gnl/TRDRNA2_/TRDRNA2_165190_c0_seq2.p1 gnl/TRDRNA2_/TRDRNA2_165190_c0~~gnl/TRDRNA2_/TRDRNA2_165190_c0_seq2.p1  ORF type:complete len:862 (-),score=165.77 gnl/TRDRNA2_/TRDRNA2_165190_c0_seq2:154-2529(-)